MAVDHKRLYLVTWYLVSRPDTELFMQMLSDLLLQWHSHQPLLYAAVTVLSMVGLGTLFALLTNWTSARNRPSTRNSQEPDAGDK